MQSLPEALGTRSGVEAQPGADHEQPQIAQAQPARAARAARLRGVLMQLRFPLAVYAGTRLLYVLIAFVDHLSHHWSFSQEVSNWDGAWYLAVTALGYPTHVTHIQSTFGFLPLYPMVIWLVAHALSSSYVFAGLLTSTIGGFVATVLVQRLATGWWGEAAGRRATLLFCLFPGSIVFSMIYSEGLLIPLAAGCLLALDRRRWLLAGILAGLATAVGPIALALVPACAVAAFGELRRSGWQDRRARRALLAPALAPVGIAAFAVFLWIWAGSPFASYIAQRYGWHEQTHALGVVHYAQHLVHQIINAPSIAHPGINLNYASGVVGAVFLIAGLWLLARTRPRISAPAITWTLGIAVLALTSAAVQPNPRMLICAFPAVIVFAYRFQGKAFQRVLGASTVLLVAMSLVTYVGIGLRP